MLLRLSSPDCNGSPASSTYSDQATPAEPPQRSDSALLSTAQTGGVWCVERPYFMRFCVASRPFGVTLTTSSRSVRTRLTVGSKPVHCGLTTRFKIRCPSIGCTSVALLGVWSRSNAPCWTRRTALPYIIQTIRQATPSKICCARFFRNPNRPYRLRPIDHYALILCIMSPYGVASELRLKFILS